MRHTCARAGTAGQPRCAGTSPMSRAASWSRAPAASLVHRRRRCCGVQRAAVSSAVTSADEPADVRRSVLREVVALGVPVLGAALSEPLLTLVDTWCLGQTCTTLTLAALSVNCGLFNFLSNSGAFLVTATTNCVASALAGGGSDSPSSTRAAGVLLGNAVLLALGLGVTTAAVLLLAPGWTLSLFGAAPGSELAAQARVYLAIRALSAPSLFLMFVGVGASLGAGNALAPALGISLAAVLNMCGDAALVLVLRTGLAGAAAATAAASWVGTAAVLHVVRTRVVAPVFVRPTWAAIAPLLRVSVALLITQVVSSVVYSYTTAFAAASGTVPAAAHQIVLQLWWLLSYAPVPLYLAAQSLLGRSLASGDTARAEGAISVLLGLGAALAAALTALTWLACRHATTAFSSDPAVATAILAAMPAACMAQALATGVTTAEGILAGAGRLKYVASVAVLSAPVGILAMRLLLLGGGAATGLVAGMPPLACVWWGLVIGEALRLGAHVATWNSFMGDVRSGKARGAVPPTDSETR